MKASLPRPLRFRPGPLPQAFRGWERALLPLLAALSLNGLLFLPALRTATAPTPAASPGARDDTPELLRFSRRQAREATLPLLPLPSQVGLLPPPPPADLAAPRVAAPGRRGLRDFGTRRRAAATTAARQEAPVTAQEPQAGAAQETAARLLALALNARAMEGADAAALQGLWEQATATREEPPELPALPEDVELRQLPLARARATGLPLQVPQAALTGGRVLLLWPAGMTLWMLRHGGP